MKNVLIVDDEPAFRWLLRITLEYEGFQCEEAENGDVAIRRIWEYPSIALVLTDYKMPEMDGLQLLTLMSANPESRKIPVVLLTADHSKTLLAKAWQVGAKYVFPKPYNLGDITTAVKALLTASKAA